MMPLPLLIALLLFALALLIVTLAYLAAPVIRDALTVETVRVDTGEDDQK